MKKRTALIFTTGLIFFSLLASQSWAGDVSIPNTFIAGQPAVAAEVNDNFDAVAAEVNDNASNIVDNADDILDINARLGVRLTQINTSYDSGSINPTSTFTWVEILELGTFNKAVEASVVELIYTVQVQVRTDGPWQRGQIIFNLLNQDTGVSYQATVGMPLIEPYDVGYGIHTLTMHSILQSVPAGTYAVRIFGRGSFVEIHVNAGNYHSMLMIKEFEIQ